MLVSAVLDPSAFNKAHFDELYTIQAEDFLKGIQRNGLLIVDPENRLRNALIEEIKSIPIKYRQQLQILVEELLKKKSKRVIACFVNRNNISTTSLLDLARLLKTDTNADALIVGKTNSHRAGIVPLSKYRDSNFEIDRDRYEKSVGPIDKLTNAEVEDIIIRTVRFSKWLRFYDPYIGRGNNTINFRKGIEYILSLWYEHGFFASQQGIGSVEIFTRGAQRWRNQDQCHKIVQDIKTPLEERFPWKVKFFIKDDPDKIFHARYLETQHAIVRVDRGFDLFKRNNKFLCNFFTLNMEESSHLKQYRDLPNVVLG